MKNECILALVTCIVSTRLRLINEGSIIALRRKEEKGNNGSHRKQIVLDSKMNGDKHCIHILITSRDVASLSCFVIYFYYFIGISD